MPVHELVRAFLFHTKFLNIIFAFTGATLLFSHRCKKRPRFGLRVLLSFLPILGLSLAFASLYGGSIIEGLVDQDLIDLAKRLRDEGIPAPEAGLYSDEDDAPMSEFQWTNKKVLVQSEDEEAYKERLQSEGWKVYGPDYDGVSLALKEE